jgi:type IV secretion system protein VirB8
VTSETGAPEPDAAEAQMPADREQHYEAARSWAYDRDTALANSRRAAWIVASLATGVAVLEALALVALAPLKTVVPYTVMVDKTTGYSTVIDGTHPQVLKPQSVLTQSMLAQYVVARETFDITTIADQYRKVGLWSEGEARTEYLALMPLTNPQSPMNIYPRSALVTVTVDSVALIGPDTAQVRFVTDRRDGPTAASTRTAYVAQIRYRFAGEPLAMDDRLVNPLGFEIAHYRRDQEALPAPGQAALIIAPAAPAGPAGQSVASPTGVAPMATGPAAMPMAVPGAGTSSAPIGPRVPAQSGTRGPAQASTQ